MPVQKDEISRRSWFRRVLGYATGVLAAGSAGVGSVQFLQAKEAPTKREVWDGKAKKIANLRDVPPNTAKVFFFPTNSVQDRCLLIRVPPEFAPLLDDQYAVKSHGLVAISGVCTHRGCIVDYNSKQCTAGQPLLGPCLCHLSEFSAINGGVLKGPATDPLPRVRLKVDDASGDIYAMELVTGKVVPPVVQDGNRAHCTGGIEEVVDEATRRDMEERERMAEEMLDYLHWRSIR